MRKIYDEYFHVPEQGKGAIRDKVLYVRIAVSIVCMVLCMFAMGYNAFAYFTASVSSTSNVLQATTYSFDRAADSIVVVADNGSVAAYGNEVGKYTLEAGTYDFTLKKAGDASTGYGRIDVFDAAGNVSKSFYTKQIGVVDEAGTVIPSRTIRIQVAKPTVIQVVACWGTYINPVENPAFDEYEEMVLVDGNLNAKVDTKVNPTKVQVVEEKEENTSSNMVNVEE